MSGFATRPAQTRAQEIDARAAAWLDRRDRDDWTAADDAALEAWLNEDPAHRITYWRMEAAWEHTKRLAALNLPAVERWKGPSFLRIAAVLALVAAGATGFWPYLSRPAGETYNTSIGGRETIMLADGTQIELNTNSVVRVLDTTRERKVWLQKGEAYFQVAHDRARPLIVYAGDRRVTDLGTKFDVRKDADNLEVAVVEGRVRFDAGNTRQDARPVVLSQGEAAVATADRMSMTRKSTRELTKELSWRRGILVFDNTPISEAAQQLNRYNQVKIVIANDAVGRLPVTGTLSATDPMEFLRMVQTVLGLHEQRVNGEIRLSR